MKFLNFFSIFVCNFCPPGSGSTDLIELNCQQLQDVSHACLLTSPVLCSTYPVLSRHRLNTFLFFLEPYTCLSCIQTINYVLFPDQRFFVPVQSFLSFRLLPDRFHLPLLALVPSVSDHVCSFGHCCGTGNARTVTGTGT